MPKLPGTRIENLTDSRFNRLIVKSYAGPKVVGGKTRHYWNCVCDCGKKVSTTRDRLISGDSQSCKCLQKEIVSSIFTKHGRSKTPEYYVWIAMKGRCQNPQNPSYVHYGGRGIKICKRWLISFEKFFSDMGARPSKRHTLERKNNARGYSPKNCEWATARQQLRNTRRNVVVTLNGKAQCLTDWANHFGINIATVRWRISAGWDIDSALKTPPRK